MVKLREFRETKVIFLLNVLRSEIIFAKLTMLEE